MKYLPSTLSGSSPSSSSSSSCDPMIDRTDAATDAGPSNPSLLPQSNRKKLPKVAIYVVGSAFVMTLGLTALVIPFAREALRNAKRFRAPSDTFSPRRYSVPHPKVDPVPGLAPRAVSKGVTGTRGLRPDNELDLGRSKRFNTLEEERLYGYVLHPLASTSAGGGVEDEDELEGTGGKGKGTEAEFDVTPLLGVGALGIATLLVGGLAAAGVWGTKWLMGVDDLEAFRQKINAHLARHVPSLVERFDDVRASAESEEGVETAANIDWFVRELGRETRVGFREEDRGVEADTG